MFPFQLGVPPVAAPATRLLVIEGDSIPASLSAPRAFANLYRDAHSDLAFYNFAVAGDHISNVDARSGWSDKMPTTNPTLTRWIYAPFCGATDFSRSAIRVWLLTSRRTWTCCRVAGTRGSRPSPSRCLPRTTADFNAFRAVFNTTVRAGTQYYDALCDFAADATMGPDSVCPDSGTFDPVWYSDGNRPAGSLGLTQRIPTPMAEVDAGAVAPEVPVTPATEVAPGPDSTAEPVTEVEAKPEAPNGRSPRRNWMKSSRRKRPELKGSAEESASRPMPSATSAKPRN
jgi:hypothetical protein